MEERAPVLDMWGKDEERRSECLILFSTTTIKHQLFQGIKSND